MRIHFGNLILADDVQAHASNLRVGCNRVVDVAELVQSAVAAVRTRGNQKLSVGFTSTLLFADEETAARSSFCSPGSERRTSSRTARPPRCCRRSRASRARPPSALLNLVAEVFEVSDEVLEELPVLIADLRVLQVDHRLGDALFVDVCQKNAIPIFG